MQQHPVHFFSDRLGLDGELYLPDRLGPGPHRGVVICSGYQGLKDIHPARFARALTKRGYVCFGFDYRGFGWSDGERGRLVPQDQVEDLRAAVATLRQQEDVKIVRLGVIGWALGGGVAITAAADDPLVDAVVAINSIGDGARALRFSHDEASYAALEADVMADRFERIRVGRSRKVDPFRIVRLDPVTDHYVTSELYKTRGFAGHGVSLESAEFLMRFRPEDHVGRIAPRPLLLIHGQTNQLHSVEECYRLAAAAGETAELLVLPDTGHTEWMFDDDPTFLGLVETLDQFLSAALDPQVENGPISVAAG